jgi:hypothetical protein
MRRLPQQSDEPGHQQWKKWHNKEFSKNKINTRIQKNLMCWKKNFAGVENQITYRLHLGRERIYTKREKGKSNEMISSRREPTPIHLFFVVMFFVMWGGGTAWSRSQ